MPRPLFDSPFIFGLHDPGGEHLMAQAERRGWIVFTMETGSDPNNFDGFDFMPWADQDFGILCRINNGYGSAGTIPHSSRHADFARRVANFIAASRGCKLWIIGNEMNHSQEWPATPSPAGAPEPAATPSPQPQQGPAADPRGRSNPTRFSAITMQQGGPVAAAITPSSADAGFEPITPELYARCFRLCRDAIKLLPGHGDDQVIIGAVAPWNEQTKYSTNPTGDWVRYFTDVLTLLGEGGLDGIALHTYTHGSDHHLITDGAKMDPPFDNRHFHFQVYRDFVETVPHPLRHLPIYITEADQDTPWFDQNNGWVQAAYTEIHRWNQEAGAQQIRTLALYRWPQLDQWHIQGKESVQDGFLEAMRQDYRWQESIRGLGKSEPVLDGSVGFQTGDTLRTLNLVNFRQTPGGAVLAQLPSNTQVRVVSRESVQQNGLVWWNVEWSEEGRRQAGWLAQAAADGTALLEKTTSGAAVAAFSIGSQVQTVTWVRMRQTPGVANKGESDLVADVAPGIVLIVVDGPASADGMTWWRNQGTLPDGRQVIGWQAEKLADGTPLLALLSAPIPPPAVEAPADTFRPGDAFRTLNLVRVRRTAGNVNKPSDDIVAEIPAATQGSIVAGPTQRDGMTWWQVIANNGAGESVGGWMAETLPDGERLMERVVIAEATFAKGDLGVTLDFANVRRTPGIHGKPSDDVLGMLYPRTTVNIISGPVTKDNLTWWRVGAITKSGSEVIGYVAEVAPGGQTLLAPAPKLPGATISAKQGERYLAAPFAGSYGISQLWGENPAFYSRFNYDGVALSGHNGIDFLTPTGTLIYAVDGGTVLQTGFEEGGFGNYILLGHPWGHSLYAHLDHIGVVAGQSVSRGQWLGMSGNTGGSTGPHLHFAVRLNPYQRTDGWGGYSDPLPYLPPSSFILPVYVQDPSSLQIPAALPSPLDQTNLLNLPDMGEISGNRRP